MKCFRFVFLSCLSFLFSAGVSFAASSLVTDINSVQKIIKKGDTVSLDKMVADGLDINMRDEDGNTLLLYALQNEESYKSAERLIYHGADLNAPSSVTGMTPMLWVVTTAERAQAEMLKKSAQEVAEEELEERDKKLEKEVLLKMSRAIKILRSLIKNNVDVNQETPFGTPLMAAVTNEWNKDIIAILIKAGADVNLQDRSGKTALFYAAAYDCNKIISQLLAAGADTDIKDFDGLTYMDVNKQDLKK